MAILDKFYTNRNIAKHCVNVLKDIFKTDFKEETFLEPTAGNGAFLDFLDNYEAYDLVPEDDRIKQMDIFNFNSIKDDYITIGNPPFGKCSKLAINVFNHVSKFSNIIAFIVPISFEKYRVQKQISKDFKLIYSEKLPENSFLDRDKIFDVNCVFQIWVRKESKYDIREDLRIKQKSSIKSKDVELWQYNATEHFLRVIEEDWKYATYRQGYKDYNVLFTRDNKQEIWEMMNGTKNGKKVQFFFIKPLNDVADSIIKKMDFSKLAAKNTSTPGFGKADFLKYFEEIKNENVMTNT